MVLTDLTQLNAYRSLHPRFAQLFDFLAENDLLQRPTGRVEVDGDNIYINVMEFDGKVRPSSPEPEAHETYIDVQILLAGNEQIGWLALNESTPLAKAYDGDEDYALYAAQPSTWLALVPKQVAIFFPEDVHLPGIGDSKIKKAVAKVRI